MAQSNRHANCQPLTVTANPISSPQSPLPTCLWLGKFAFFFYVLLMLFPPSEGIGSGGLRVLLWQVGLLCPVLWLLGIVLRQRLIPRLGGGWDAIALLAILMAIVSTMFAESPNGALECAIAAAGYWAAVYALKYYLKDAQHRHGLLIWQGYVNLGFILYSLVGWLIFAGIPAWRHWQAVRGLGGEVEVSIAPNEIPLGTPGAIAAYLVLALPLLVGLAIADRGWRRGLWIAGIGLGLLDLYTTDSALAWLGLGGLGVFGLATISLPKWGAKGVGLVAVGVGILFAAVRAISAADVAGMVTRVAGWQMALDRLWTGVGLGGVSLLYPQYRPFWGGRLGEWTGHIRSTPLQVLAECGIGGAILAVVAIALFAYQAILWQVRFRPWEMVAWARHRSSDTDRAVFVDSLFPLCLYGGCLAYAIVGWLDYSLDRPAIAGTLVLYLSVLISRWRVPPVAPIPLLIPLAGLGFLGAAIVWLTPVRYAGLLAVRGVAALQSAPPDVASCVRDLTKAHQLASGKPEYPLQLGWVSGSLRWQEETIPKETIDWWQRGIAAAPDWVFGYPRLGWLLLKNDPPLAAKAFGRAIELVPAQRGAFYGLGRALLSEGQTERAIEAFALEIFRDPAFLTRPLWAQPDLEPLFDRVGDRLEEKYAILLKDESLSPELKRDLHQNRGGLRWWLENYKQAREDWQEYGSETSKLVLQLASLESSESVETELRLLPPSTAKWAIEAWLHPEHRLKRLQDAWALAAPETVSPEIVGQSLSTMNAAPNFDDWLKRGSPTQMTPLFDAYGILGDGVFEGGKLEDFPQLSENTVLTHFFADRLWRSPDYFPELDEALQLWRTALLKATLQGE